MYSYIHEYLHAKLHQIAMPCNVILPWTVRFDIQKYVYSHMPHTSLHVRAWVTKCIHTVI